MESYQLRHFRRVLGDRYEFQAFLGRGAFASVYLVQNVRLRRREALKILADTFSSDSVARFVAEATMVASLDHPNIVPIYEYGEVEGVLWYSMKYIEGPMLRDEMSARKRFDSASAVRIAIPLLGALDASHQRGIVHRDLKPSNVILNREGRPYLMDFGIAKADDSHLKTMTGSVLGTPAYMAPEQAEGRALDGRADLYSLGLVLYQMLAGRSPWDTQEPVQLLLLRLRDDAPRLSSFAPEVDPELEAILMKTLARDREERFSSARELLRHLVAFLGDERDPPPLELAAPAGSAVPLEPEGPSTGGPIAPTPSAPTAELGIQGGTHDAAPRPAPVWLRWAAAAASAVALGAVGVWLYFAGSSSSGSPAPASSSRPAATSGVIPAATPSVPAAAPAPDAASSERLSSPSSSPSSEVPAEAAGRSSSGSVQAEPADGQGSRSVPRDGPMASASLGASASARPAAAPSPAPASPAPPRRAVRPPRLVERSEPALAGESAARCAGTSVIVSIQVGEDGRPTAVRPLGTSPAECRTPVEEAALRYRFDPALDAEGRPTSAGVTISVQLGGVQ